MDSPSEPSVNQTLYLRSKITHLDIHLKHTWELAWVIEEVQEFSW